MKAKPIMLNVSHVSKTFESGFFGSHQVKAVDDVSFCIENGEIFGLVGGSGCGKTTVSKIIAGLIKPDEGSVVLDGVERTTLSKHSLRKSSRDIQMVFQNPQKTFNPRFTVYECCAEPIRIWNLANSKEEEYCRVVSMLDAVGISKDQMDKYPHEISGGQAQRIAIIRVLELEPKLLICDEPTSMLDVSVQAQIMALLNEVHKQRNVDMLYISHDLDVVRSMCERVAVMNNGKICEMGLADKVFSNPEHAFTQRLVSSIL